MNTFVRYIRIMNHRILYIVLVLLLLPAIGWALPQLRTSHPLDPEKPVEARTIAKEKKPFHAFGENRTLHPIGAEYISLDNLQDGLLLKNYASAASHTPSIVYHAGTYIASPVANSDDHVAQMANLSTLIYQLNAWSGRISKVGSAAPAKEVTISAHRLPTRPPGEPMPTPLGDLPCYLFLLFTTIYIICKRPLCR